MTSSQSEQQQEEGMEIADIVGPIESNNAPPSTKPTKSVTNDIKKDSNNNNSNHHHDLHEKLSSWIQMESYFFNHGAELAFYTFLIAMNICMGAWGAWLFTAPTWTTTSDVLRITLPIARASGRIVTLDISLLFLSACKFFITWIRANTIIPYGFPIDNVMPEYHRMIAYMIIIMGCIVHTAPQVYNYASQTLLINGNLPIWSFGQGLSTRSLLYTGIILWFTFVMFSLSTLESFRRTTIGFRWFWALHITGIVIVIPTLLIHGTYLGTPITFYFMIIPLVLYLIDFYLRRIYYFSRECKLISLIPHSEEKVTEVHIQLSQFSYTPGQYVDINIPELAKYEWHPFTIASAPEIDHKADSIVNLTFYIKASGRWTNALYDIAILQQQKTTEGLVKDAVPIIPLSVKVVGPFGAPAQNYFQYKHIIIIGSGIGVTPLLSIWKYLVNQATVLINDEEESKPLSRHHSVRHDLTTDDITVDEEWEEDHILNDFNLSYVGIQNFTHLTSSIFKKSVVSATTTSSKIKHQHHHENHYRVVYAYYASMLESMTVNICMFLFAMTMETIVFVVWLFNKTNQAALMQIIVSSIALLLFGSKVITSTIAYGKRYYIHSIVFRLDLSIVIIDLTS